MRIRKSAWGWLFALLFAQLAGCTSLHADGNPRANHPSRATPTLTPFSFEDTASMLASREILLQPVVDPDPPDLLPLRAFERRLDARMRRHPHWRVLSVHLAIVDMPDPHFEIFDKPMYVVEITGPRTGNCFDLYEATNGGYDGSACFYPHRTEPTAAL